MTDIDLCAFDHAHPDDAHVVAVMRAGPYAGMSLCEEHWASVEDADDGDDHAEHFDDIVMDCPLCVAEWQAIGGKA